MTFTDNGNGTATLCGTPAAGTTGMYDITIGASNGISPDASQSFALTVNTTLIPPAITSGDSTTFQVGTDGYLHRYVDGDPDRRPSPSPGTFQPA